MRKLRGWLLRLGGLFGKERRERDFAKEVESHLQMHIEDNLRAGMKPKGSRVFPACSRLRKLRAARLAAFAGCLWLPSAQRLPLSAQTETNRLSPAIVT